MSGGKYVVGGTIALGAKDRSEHVHPEAYFDKLKYTDTKYVILWDEETKRGWLMNGTSALLHLVRLSLKADREGRYSHRLVFDEEKLQDDGSHGPCSAAYVLSNQVNQELEVWPGKTELVTEQETKSQLNDGQTESTRSQKRKRGYTLFEDRVEQQYAILELVLESQLYLQRKDGINLKLRARKHLEGWDFREMAIGKTIRPRVATLHAFGCGWVDFARSIEAVTLFGKGFGDILQPAQTKNMCSEWQRLPKGKYYLATSLYDLNMVMDDFGSKAADGTEVIHDLVWHSPHHPYAYCSKCGHHKLGESVRNLVSKHHDPVQVFCPQWSSVFRKTRRPGQLGQAGVVVFGHTVSWPYLWKGEKRQDAREENLLEMPPNTLDPPAVLIVSSQTMFESESTTNDTSVVSSSAREDDSSYERQSHTSYSHHSASKIQGPSTIRRQIQQPEEARILQKIEYGVDITRQDESVSQEELASASSFREHKEGTPRAALRKKQRVLSLSQRYSAEP